MQRDETDYCRRRAQELRAIAYFLDDRKKRDTLLWLANDYESVTEHGKTAEPASLVRRLHMMHMAEKLRPLRDPSNI